MIAEPSSQVLTPIDLIQALGLEQHISLRERLYLSTLGERLSNFPESVEEIWRLMNEAWIECGCESGTPDGRFTDFYEHPVWLLNGLFIEKHSESIAHRHKFTEWVKTRMPLRIADYGGGFGGLARMIGTACPSAEVEVIEPHVHPVAREMAASISNVRYHSNLRDQYDLLIATDVFEHLADPLAEVARTATHLKAGGAYLIANCFWPIIHCHLPQTFHFRYSWSAALCALGFQPGPAVAYGRVFFHEGGPLDLNAARRVEHRSSKLFPIIERIPTRLARELMARLLFPA